MSFEVSQLSHKYECIKNWCVKDDVAPYLRINLKKFTCAEMIHINRKIFYKQSIEDFNRDDLNLER